LDAVLAIPGFRNAILRGMSRRIREADDRLAAYADRAEGAKPPDGGGAAAL